MYWHRFSRFDKILIVTSFIGLILSTFFIFEDRWIYKLLINDSEKLQRIGYVQTSVNDVRQRHATAFSWRPLESSDEVFQGDSIFTGSRSEAIILTDRGEKISISPNSLVVINSKSDSIRLDIDYGSVLGQVGKDKTLLISSGGDVTEFKGDDAVVKVDVREDQKVVVNVIEGQVEVKSDEGQRLLGPQQKAEITEVGTISEVADVHLDPLTPVPDRVLKPDEARDLILTWHSNYAFQEYTVEIAKDPEFTRVILRDKASQPLYRPPSLPTNERLFWRVSGQLKPNQSPARSRASAFTLAEDKPPVLTFPRENMRLSFEEAPPTEVQALWVTLTWLPQSISNQWDVQVSTSPDFVQGLKSFVTKDHFVALGALNEGTHYARVRAKDWSNANWSETIAFVIAKKSSATLRPPQVISAEEEFLLITKFLGYTASQLNNVSPEEVSNYVEAIPELIWNSIPGATGYEIEISDKPDFSQLVKREEVASSRYAWSGVRIGKFYWRIRAISTDNRRGPFSEAQPLKVVLSAPHSLTPEKNVDEVTDLTQMESAPPPFLLRWSPTLFTPKYEVEFDKNPTLSKALKVITPNPFKKIQAPVAGSYFWRVRSLSGTNQPLTEWSDINRFEYARAYLSPETTKELKALYPNNETIMLIGQGEIKIHFRWASPIKEGLYRFQLSKNEDFKNPQLDFVTDKSFFLMREEMKDGWYYWRLRLESKQFTSPWTAAYKFQIQHEFSPFNFEASEKRKEKELRALEAKRATQMAEYRKKVDANASELARLEIESLPQLEAPTDLSAPDSFNLSARPLKNNDRTLEQIPDSEQFALLQDAPTLEWAPTTKALEYRIEIASDSEFKSIVERVRSNHPSHRWLKARPGRYYWRTLATAKGFRDSGWSETGFFELGVVPPTPITPHAILVRAEDQSVLLKWSSVPFAHSYEVEFSSSPDFSSKSSTVVNENRLNQKVDRDGLYFWHVRSLNAQKTPLHDFTLARSINLSIGERAPASSNDSNKTPVLVYPFDQQTLHVSSSEDEIPRLAFSWIAPEQMTGQYVLEIAKDAAFNEVVQKLTTKATLLIADAPPHRGQLHWRLATTEKGKITWRSPSRLIKFVSLPSRQTASQKKIPAKALPTRSK